MVVVDYKVGAVVGWFGYLFRFGCLHWLCCLQYCVFVSVGWERDLCYCCFGWNFGYWLSCLHWFVYGFVGRIDCFGIGTRWMLVGWIVGGDFQ